MDTGTAGRRATAETTDTPFDYQNDTAGLRCTGLPAVRSPTTVACERRLGCVESELEDPAPSVPP